MKSDELSELIEKSETHRLILGNHPGPYSLGVTTSPNPAEGSALLLKVPSSEGFPDFVTIRGRKIRLIVEGGFKGPRPLRSQIQA